MVLWMNTVGPYHNRQETYAYFSLPFCKGPKESISHYHETLGEALLGTELELSGLQIDFKKNVAKTEFCQIAHLSQENYKTFVYAVQNQYSYQMVLDDLPIIGIIGDIDGDKKYLWTHKKIEIGYNGKQVRPFKSLLLYSLSLVFLFQIIDVNVTSESRILLKEGGKIPFSYEVIWKESETKFADRFDRYLDPNFFQHRVNMMAGYIIDLRRQLLNFFHYRSIGSPSSIPS